MQKNPAAEEVIRRLNAYYDAESEIEEELRTIEHAQEQRSRISLRSPSLTGLPGGKGQHSDQTADLATSSPARMYDEDIKAAWARIAKLRADRNWVTAKRRSPLCPPGLTVGSSSLRISGQRSRSAGEIGSPGRHGMRWPSHWAYRKRMRASRPTGSYSSSRV